MRSRSATTSAALVCASLFGWCVQAASAALPQQQPERFRGGDIYVLSSAVPLTEFGLTGTNAIVRMDPITGQQSIVRQVFPAELQNIVYDHYRDRLIFAARLPDGHSDLWSMDADANLTSLGHPDDPVGITLVATANDGRLYFLREAVRLNYVDADNVSHVVTAISGTGPALLPAVPDSMHFDAATNSLFFVYGSYHFYYTCGSQSTYDWITIRKLTLSTDGTRIIADECNSTVVPGDTVGTGLSSGPDGKIVLVWRGGSGAGLAPRIQLVDPMTLQFESYASNGPYAGGHLLNAGCYSALLDGVVVADFAGPDVRLRTMRRGATGGRGTAIGDHHVTVGFGAFSIGGIVAIDKPRDTDPPQVGIEEPHDGAVVRDPSVLVRATVVDESGTDVASDPVGVTAHLPPGGGVASGSVPLSFEGANLITVQATDSSGNAAGTIVTVIRDTIPPAITIMTPVDGMLFSAAPISIHAQIEDATATTVSFDGQVDLLEAGGGTAAFDAVLVEGANLLTVVAVDAAGNVLQRSVTVRLDESAPLVTIARPMPEEVFGAGETPIPVEVVVDDVSATTVGSDPSGVSSQLPAGGGIAVGVVALEEGDNTILVSATDATGRRGAATVSVRLDTTGPQVEITSPAAMLVAHGVVDFNATVFDPLPGTGVVRVDFLVDGVLADSFVDPQFEVQFDSELINDGGHLFEVVAVDGKGNVGRAVSTVTVDNGPPSVAITSPASNALVRGTIPFDVAIADAGAGVESVQMMVGGGAPTRDGSALYAVPITATVVHGEEDTTRWPDGPLALVAHVVDAAGNEELASIEVTVDNTAPTKALVAPLDGSTVTGTIDLIGRSDASDVVSLEIAVDGVVQATSTTSPLSSPFDTTRRRDGTMIVTLVVTDLAGNTGTCSATVTVRNLKVKIDPQTLDLSSKEKESSLTVHVKGTSASLLLPVASHVVELRVPGGTPVRAKSGSGDDERDARDGSRATEAEIKFDRQKLIASIRAGIAAGQIQPNSSVIVALFVDGREIGHDVIRINSRRERE